MGTMAYEIPVTQARAELAELINRVVYGGERVVVTRHGKPLVALVSAADLQRLERDEASEEAAATERVIRAVSSFGPARWPSRESSASFAQSIRCARA